MVGEVVDLLLILVKAHFTTETIRHLATYLTATLCQGMLLFNPSVAEYLVEFRHYS